MTFHGMLSYQAVLVVFVFFFMVVFLFNKCTNISCSDEYLFYIALIEALELPRSIGKEFCGWNQGGMWANETGVGSLGAKAEHPWVESLWGDPW